MSWRFKTQEEMIKEYQPKDTIHGDTWMEWIPGRWGSNCFFMNGLPVSDSFYELLNVKARGFTLTEIFGYEPEGSKNFHPSWSFSKEMLIYEPDIEF